MSARSGGDIEMEDLSNPDFGRFMDRSFSENDENEENLGDESGFNDLNRTRTESLSERGKEEVLEELQSLQNNIQCVIPMNKVIPLKTEVG